MAANLWTSNRLVFRAAEDDDDAFLETLNHDSHLFTQAAAILPTPQGKKSGTFLREMLQKDLLGVIICLPAPAPATTAETTAASKPIPIGMIALWEADGGAPMAHHRNAEMGLNILPTYQGQGYGTEAILWALKFAFQMANLHKVHLGVFGWNPGAKRLYERLGFVLEGCARDHFWFAGQYRDLYEMGMLEGEWRERYGGESESEVAIRPKP